MNELFVLNYHIIEYCDTSIPAEVLQESCIKLTSFQ